MTTTAQPEQGTPIRQRDLLQRLAGSDACSAQDALSGATLPATELEGFRPLGQSLEWRLADAYWDQAGIIPFVRNDVPYLVNNTGRLSDNAAALLMAALDELGSALPQRLVVLELGAGTGLHARYFLDAFYAMCQKAGRDYYDRLLYIVTDRFERTVQRWKTDGLFTEHSAHVALRVCDARAAADILREQASDGDLTQEPFLILCNYILDVLPSTVARRGDNGLQQLCVRTHLAGGAASLGVAGL